jgi:hypothetical protein
MSSNEANHRTIASTKSVSDDQVRSAMNSGLQCGDGNPGAYKYSNEGKDKNWFEFKCSGGACAGKVVDLANNQRSHFSATKNDRGSSVVIAGRSDIIESFELTLDQRASEISCDILGSKETCFRVQGKMTLGNSRQAINIYCLPASGDW